MGEGGAEKDDKTGYGSSARSPEFAELSARFLAEQTAMMSMMTAFGVQMAGALMGAVATALDKKKAEAPVEPVQPVADAGPAPVQPVETPKAEPVKRARKKAPRAVADDLKKISGIGPRLEKVLNGMGVTTYAQIAKWSDEDMLKMDETLGLDNRIIRDQWVTQAKALLEG